MCVSVSVSVCGCVRVCVLAVGAGGEGGEGLALRRPSASGSVWDCDGSVGVAASPLTCMRARVLIRAVRRVRACVR